MKLAVYEAIDDYQADHEKGEISERVEPSGSMPALGDRVKMGSDRLWEVVAVETYISGENDATLALVHPLGMPVPARETWNQVTQRESYPDVCLNLSQKPQQAIEIGGWSMVGKPLTGQLYGGLPTEHPTLLRPVALNWVFDEFDTYQPINEGEGFYTAIHLCRCVPLQTPEMAVA